MKSLYTSLQTCAREIRALDILLVNRLQISTKNKIIRAYRAMVLLLYKGIGTWQAILGLRPSSSTSYTVLLLLIGAFYLSYSKANISSKTWRHASINSHRHELKAGLSPLELWTLFPAGKETCLIKLAGVVDFKPSSRTQFSICTVIQGMITKLQWSSDESERARIRRTAKMENTSCTTSTTTAADHWPKSSFSNGAFTKVYLNYAFFLSFHIWSPKWVLATGMATHPSITFWSPKLDRPGSRGSGRHQATGVFAGRWRHPALNKPLLWLPVIPRPRVGLMAATTP